MLFRLRNEVENINENDLDEVEREYNRLAPEYNRLIEYLNSISRKFTLLQQQFNDEQVRLSFLVGNSFLIHSKIESRKSSKDRR